MKCETEGCEKEATRKVILPDKIRITRLDGIRLLGTYKELNLCRECWETYIYWQHKLEEVKTGK